MKPTNLFLFNTSPMESTMNKPNVNTTSRYGNGPAALLEPVFEITPEEIPGVVQSLHDAFLTDKTRSVDWRKGQLRALKRMITEKEAELCQALFEDLHKSPVESFVTELSIVHGEIDTALSELDNWMKPKKKKNSAFNIPCWATTQQDPLGVVVVFGAWNYPVNLSLAPIIGAIAGGNCVILKPGSYAQASSNTLARIAPQYLDTDYIRIIEGDRHVTNALLKEKTDMIFFTGSAFVGKLVARAAAENLTPCVLELGGKSPCVVDKSVNIDHAAKRIVWAKFLNAGQTCVSCDFLLVHEDVADKLQEALKKSIHNFYGNNAQKTEFYGRLINNIAFNRLRKLIEVEKPRVIFGGRVDDTDRFIEPTLIDFKSDMTAFSKSDLMADELFGPILPICRYKNVDEAVSFIRGLPTGKPLALYAYGNDPVFVDAMKHRTTSGGLCINDSIMHLANHDLPFGGVGNSGMGGGYHGYYSFQKFTHEKAVLEKIQAMDNLPFIKPLLELRFPPYSSSQVTILRHLSNHTIESAVNLPLPAFRFIVKIVLAYIAMRMIGFDIVHK